MADYYPLLARALEAMPDRSAALRKAVYERARGALIGQLRSLDPPLSEADIDMERSALEFAIDRLEVDYGSVAQPEPAPPPPPPAAVPEVEPAVNPPRRIEPALPPAPPPDLGVPGAAPANDALPEPVSPDEGAPVGGLQPRRAKGSSETTAPAMGPIVVPEPPPAHDAADAAGVPQPDDASVLLPDVTSGRQRPRIDVVKPRGGRSRLLRNIFVGSVLVVVIGLIAVAAFLLRDKPADLQPSAAETEGDSKTPTDSKYADRIGGDPTATERPAPASNPPATVKPPTQPDVAVAQRAVLYEENTAQNAAPAPVQGRVIWRLDAVNGEQGQPLETVVRATVEFPEAGLTLTMNLRRNMDATLPASHTIELAFTNTTTNGEKRAVQDIGLIQAKDEEGARGSPVSGLPVRVRENLFLIGLSSLRNDIDRNTDLLLHKNWFDLAIKFSAGPRGIVTFEKGGSGTQVMQQAFDEWSR